MHRHQAQSGYDADQTLPNPDHCGFAKLLAGHVLKSLLLDYEGG